MGIDSSIDHPSISWEVPERSGEAGRHLERFAPALV